MLCHRSKWLPFGSVPEFTANELWERVQSDEIQLIDVRTPQEWRYSAIKGSQNIPLTRFFRKTVESLELDMSKPVVVICLTAHRSIPAVRILRDMGFEDARQLQGGMTQWWKYKLPCCKH
jgi:rhodanese-related sulfurtransferase